MNTTKNVYCRLCAELKPHNKLTNLQTDEETCQKVVDKLSKFNIIMDFQENILPNTVCLVCIKSLERTFAFVTAVEQAQVFLSEFNLVQTRTMNSDSYGETTLYEPSDDNKEVKVESSQDPMDVNDSNDEECDIEDNCNVYNADDNNLGSEKVNIENKDITQYSYVIDEEKNGIKDETDEYTAVNNVNNIKDYEPLKFSNDRQENQYMIVTENDLNIKDTQVPSALKEKVTNDNSITENHFEPIPPLDNSVYSTDYITEQNHSNEGTKTVDPSVRSIHDQCIPKPTPPQLLDTTEYSEDYINKQINRLSVVPVQYLKMTWMNYEWKCSRCGTVFSNIEELQKHSMIYHNICNAYQCTDCKIKKQCLNAFMKHVKSHRKYLHYSCYKCFEKFPKTMETIHHKKKIHENFKHICLGCNTPFSSNTELEEHVNKYYNILCRPRTVINSDNLTCDTCNKVCANITTLKNHLNTHKEKKRDRVCDRCGKCFESERNLRTHMYTHIEKILYHCEICKSTFTTVSSLRSHASIHSGIKPFTCDVCSKCFRTKSQIRNHMKFHTDYFPITCSICNKKFRTVTYLQNHMLQHTGEKPFSCDICPRDFTNMANRNKHMRQKHGIEMAKKRQPIIKQQTSNEPTSSDLAGQAKFTDLDKMNEWKNKIMEHRKSQRAKNKIKELKVISKECNEN